MARKVTLVEVRQRMHSRSNLWEVRAFYGQTAKKAGSLEVISVQECSSEREARDVAEAFAESSKYKDEIQITPNGYVMPQPL